MPYKPYKHYRIDKDKWQAYIWVIGKDYDYELHA